MATDHVKEWVKETKNALNDCEQNNNVAVDHYLLMKCVVSALLTIAIAIHEAAAEKRKK